MNGPSHTPAGEDEPPFDPADIARLLGMPGPTPGPRPVDTLPDLNTWQENDT